MKSRFTLGQLMGVVAVIALEFGLLPTPLAVVAACLTLILPVLTPRLRWGFLGFTSLAGLIAGVCLPPVSTQCYITDPCKNNLRQIALALLCYRRDYGCFPPAYLADATGKPMHSWRVLVLPYLDRKDLYDSYNFAEPWDSPNNSKLAGMMPSLYACWENKASGGMTCYMAIVGPGTAFPDSGTTSSVDFTDGEANTILLVEVANTNISWLEPRDLDARTMSFRINDPRRPSISTLHHKGKPCVCFVDGSVKRLDNTLPQKTLKALTTINGVEVIGEQRIDH